MRDIGEDRIVAEYQYLGTTTAVEANYPLPAVALTYLKQGSEPDGDAGDAYNGLDRFVRKVPEGPSGPSGATRTASTAAASTVSVAIAALSP